MMFYFLKTFIVDCVYFLEKNPKTSGFLKHPAPSIGLKVP